MPARIALLPECYPLMHIAYITASLSEHYGGPPRTVTGLANAVSVLNHQVSHWAPTRANDKIVAEGDQANLFPVTFPMGWYRAPKFASGLAEAIERIDLLHIQEIWSYPQWCAAGLAAKHGKLFLVSPRGVLDQWRMQNRGKLRLLKKNVYLATLGRGLLKNAACLHALTDAEIAGFRSAGYRGPVTVLPNGIDLLPYQMLPERDAAEQKWPQLKDRFVVLFLSRLSSEKGIDRLLRVWKEFRNFDPLLVLAGPDDKGYRATVEGLIDQYGLKDRTLLTGPVFGQDKLQLIARADLYTLPSHSEGFSMSVLENLAAARPILISSACNFPEVAASGAGICVSDDAELKQGFKEFFNMSREDRFAMGEAGRRLVSEHYSWPVVARKMIKVYQAILRNETPPEHPSAD